LFNFNFYCIPQTKPVTSKEKKNQKKSDKRPLIQQQKHQQKYGNRMAVMLRSGSLKDRIRRDEIFTLKLND
jgi:hypothetical protein